MLALDGIASSSPAPTASWELNDVRPIPKPARPSGVPRGRPLKLVDLFFMCVQYADGWDAILLYDPGKYHVDGLELLMSEWMGSWLGI
jgi:hypothetical protein